MGVFIDVLTLTIAFAVPLLLVALGGMFSERSGIINIALEGIMIMGALFGCLFLSAFRQNSIIANMLWGEGDEATKVFSWAANNSQLLVFCAIIVCAIVGIIYSLLLAFASIKLKADQTIGGTALNILAPALAVTITWAIQGEGQTAIYLPTWVTITPEIFGKVSTNTLIEQLFFKNLYLTTPIAVIVLIITTIVLYKTKIGLRLRSCGEHPQAADSVGINVYKMRYLGVAISGALAGIGGLAYAFAAFTTGFESSVAGYGFLALAVMIFGNWKPINILGASVFFALFKTLGSNAANIPFLPKFTGVKNPELIYWMLPYFVTMIVLILTSKKSMAPKAEGIPYDKGAR